MLELWVRRRCKALFGACAFTTFILLCVKYIYLNEVEMSAGRARLLDLPLAPAARSSALDGNMISYDQMQDPDGSAAHSNSPESDGGVERFDMTRRSDVMVFLHIQKTGGTVFERHLIKDLDIEHPCVPEPGRKRYKCHRLSSKKEGSWIFSRYSSGWHCGLHADWTELTNCVDGVIDRVEGTFKRRYFYVTLLREPRYRFLSEFRHVQRGATWKTSRHICNGRSPTSDELPPCYNTPDWMDVTFEEFVTCRSNLAVNRMTRMLADLTLVGCYNESAMPRAQRDALMLASAKSNLRKLAFFALCEYQKISQYLFERTFGLRFKQAFVQYNYTRSSVAVSEVSSADLERIDKLNHLDNELYAFAKALLMERFERAKRNDPDFEENFNRVMNEVGHD